MSCVERRKIDTRVFRAGETPPDDGSVWRDTTPEQRMLAVWELTLYCLAWDRFDEPRLQRSISRVQRGRR